MLRLGRPALCLLALSPAASAHLVDIEPQQLRWTLAPCVTIPVVLALVGYAVGHARLRKRTVHARVARRRQASYFMAGWLTLVAAAISPLHAAGERSFTLHMIEHELLMLVAAPLLILSGPLETMLWALPSALRKSVGRLARSRAVDLTWRWLRNAVFATTLQSAVLWVWHAPYFFERALVVEGWHIAQHLCFVISALLFWSAMLRDRHCPTSAAVASLCLFATSVISGALGALMAFSASPWYARYTLMGMAPFGLTALEDQQLAGLLMWIPGGLVHAGAALVLLHSLTRMTTRVTPAHPG
jgi:putative membrane protein